MRDKVTHGQKRLRDGAIGEVRLIWDSAGRDVLRRARACNGVWYLGSGNGRARFLQPRERGDIAGSRSVAALLTWN
jgi:hypothetical protein